MSTIWFRIFLFLPVLWTFPLHVRGSNGAPLLKNKVEKADPNNFIKRSRTEKHFRERIEPFLEMIGGRRTNRQDLLKYHRSQCMYMNQPWAEDQENIYHQDSDSVFLLKVFTGPLRPMFPQQNLFNYIRRLYRCCKLRFTCKRVKGLQGKLDVGDGKKEMEFYIDADLFSLSIQRAELHLEISLSDQLTVIPALTAKGITHSRFTQLRNEHDMDLALDVMFLLQMLKEMDSEDVTNEKVTELSLSLHCIRNELLVPCNIHGVSLLHPPFLTLQYE